MLVVDNVEKASWTTTTSNADYSWSGKVLCGLDVKCADCDGSNQLTVNTLTVDGEAVNGNASGVVYETSSAVVPSTGILSAANSLLRFRAGGGHTYQYDQPQADDAAGVRKGVGSPTRQLFGPGNMRAVAFDTAGRVTRAVVTIDSTDYNFRIPTIPRDCSKRPLTRTRMLLAPMATTLSAGSRASRRL